MKIEDLLTNALTNEPKKWFLDFLNAWSIVIGESNIDSFIMGFRLGANFAYDAFISSETPFEAFFDSKYIVKTKSFKKS